MLAASRELLRVQILELYQEGIGIHEITRRLNCAAEEYYYSPYNVTRTTLSGIQAYRSALTLDWLAAEDSRQHELAAAFETEATPPARVLATDCIAYPRPSAGKVARLMLELLKNLEGDNAKSVPELIQVLVKTGLLVEISTLDVEPSLETLVKTPGMMMGEPHVTFPRVMAMIWMTITDPGSTKKYGWCPINKVTKYLSVNKPSLIAKQLRALEPIISRARYIMEEFVQNITPLNMYTKRPTRTEGHRARAPAHHSPGDIRRAAKTVKGSTASYVSEKMEEFPPGTFIAKDFYPRVIDEDQMVKNACSERRLHRAVTVVALWFLQ